ncbi:hypothetical protein OsJ_30727 [Oryza sativa Japonica Group]|uniref:Proline-rich protein n=1 Tax=Oryza sativa subsp. japonica TaxID=39947 RepID=B9G7J2_ORYSJ|nr:hypothetical protein OsJ_30727 [Oryza sativa Japonica Group]
MGALPRALVLGVCAAVLLVNVLAVAADGDAAAAASMVVGLAKCADCTRKNMKAEAVFKGVRVAIKCKNSNGEYETKATGEVGKSGAEPVVGSSNAAADKKKTFVAVAGDTHFPSSECASAFLCDPFHKKDFFFHYKNPSPPAPAAYHKPPPSYTHPAPPVYSYPTPAYSHPTPVYKQPLPTPSPPIYHPPAEEKKVAMQDDAEADPELFKKLLPLIKKNPFLKFPKLPPVEVEAKP